MDSSKVEIERVKGIFYYLKYTDGISILTSEGRFEIDAWNDCCGYSNFEFPNDFDQMVELCHNGKIRNLFQEDVNYLKKAGKQCGVTFEYVESDEEDADREELENILFVLEVEQEDGVCEELVFGVRSFHNGYYPVQISITHYYENVAQCIKGHTS